MSHTSTDWPRIRSTLALVAGTLVSLAVVPGYPREIAVILISVGAVIAALAVGLRRWPWPTRPPKNLNHIAIISTASIGLLFSLETTLVLLHPVTVAEWVHWLLMAWGLAATATAVILTGGRRKWLFIAFLATYTIVLLIMLNVNVAEIDVIQFQSEASNALFRGGNPYTVVYPDIYGMEDSRLFYGGGVSVDGVLQFGFPYLPLSLLVVAPFQWFLADFRFAQMIAIIGMGWLISRLSNEPAARLIALAFLLISPAVFVNRSGWTEPLLAFAGVLVMFTYQRRANLAPYAMGVLLALKQYALILLPSYLLLLGHPIRLRDVLRSGIRIGAVFVTVTIPFFLWNPEAFLRSAVFLQFRQPTRLDSLSILTQTIRFVGTPPLIVITIVPFVAVLAAIAFSLRRAPLGAQGFALANALAMLVWPLFAKQAFINYYFLAIGFLFAAAAVMDAEHHESAEVAEAQHCLSPPPVHDDGAHADAPKRCLNQSMGPVISTPASSTNLVE